jgi:hypothetical protein
MLDVCICQDMWNRLWYAIIEFMDNSHRPVLKQCVRDLTLSLSSHKKTPQLDPVGRDSLCVRIPEPTQGKVYKPKAT